MRRVWQENGVRNDAIFHATKEMGSLRMMRLIGSFMKKYNLNIYCKRTKQKTEYVYM